MRRPCDDAVSVTERAVALVRPRPPAHAAVRLTAGDPHPTVAGGQAHLRGDRVPRWGMGLFGKRRKDGVRGTARVVSTSHAPQATHGSLTMQIVVEAPGIPAYSHSYKKFGARVDKWPSPGDVVPVSVDPDDPTKVDVLWDDIVTNRDAARQEADQLAERLRQGSPGVAGAPPEVAGMVDQLQQMFPGAIVNIEGAIAAEEADPSPPLAPPIQVSATQSDADPVERLEKLAKLRDAGIVDQTQFEHLRAQILKQSGLDDS